VSEELKTLSKEWVAKLNDLFDQVVAAQFDLAKAQQRVTDEQDKVGLFLFYDQRPKP
jgi:hypothetical protein